MMSRPRIVGGANRRSNSLAAPRIPLTSKSQADWELFVTISDARNDPREAVWYGPWLTVLQSHLFFNFCPMPLMTRTFPQYPLTRDIDVYDAQNLEDIHPEYNASPTQALSQSRNQADHSPGSTTSFESYGQPELKEVQQGVRRFTREGAPSPEVPLRRNPSTQPQTPPISSSAFGATSNTVDPQTPPRRPTSPLVSSDSSPQSFTRVVQRSTRLPDFAQLLYKLEVDRRDTLDASPRYAKRLVCLVEIKRWPTKPTTTIFSSVLDQTTQQAHHAFAAFADLQRLPVIIALGDLWTYVEYARETMSASPSWSERLDPSYRNTSESGVSNGRGSVYHMPNDIERLLTNVGHAQLGTQTSDRVLDCIRRRVRELNQDM